MLLGEAPSGQRQVFPEGPPCWRVMVTMESSCHLGGQGLQCSVSSFRAWLYILLSVLTLLYLHPAPAPGDTAPERPPSHLSTPTGHVIFSEHSFPMLPCCPHSSYLGRL